MSDLCYLRKPWLKVLIFQSESLAVSVRWYGQRANIEFLVIRDYDRCVNFSTFWTGKLLK